MEKSTNFTDRLEQKMIECTINECRMVFAGSEGESELLNSIRTAIWRHDQKEELNERATYLKTLTECSVSGGLASLTVEFSQGVGVEKTKKMLERDHKFKNMISFAGQPKNSEKPRAPLMLSKETQPTNVSVNKQGKSPNHLCPEEAILSQKITPSYRKKQST